MTPAFELAKVSRKQNVLCHKRGLTDARSGKHEITNDKHSAADAFDAHKQTRLWWRASGRDIIIIR